MSELIQNFAVFEGGDGSGTTTQLDLLRQRLANSEAAPSRPVFFPTFEPTEGPAGRLIRSALKGEVKLLGETLARLFAADRGEHLYGTDGVVSRCARGELVVSDRYALSSLVYQGIECGDALPAALNASFPLPELLVFFDIDPEIAQRRIQNRPGLEIYEYLEFQRKVREKYRSLLESWRTAGVRVVIVDAAKSPEAVAAEVWACVSKMPILNV